MLFAEQTVAAQAVNWIVGITGVPLFFALIFGWWIWGEVCRDKANHDRGKRDGSKAGWGAAHYHQPRNRR
jgi:hypothetical protein